MLPGVKHKIVVMSGKGGVGKSTVAVNIAAGLAERGHSVGILDADIHGPSIPRLLGAPFEHLEMLNGLIQPAEVLPRLKVISIAYFLEEKDAPVVWRGPVKMGALKQFIEDVDWGDLDYLIIDLPPGTGDEPLTIAQSIPEPDGAVIVTTPQDIALTSVRRSIRFASLVKLKVLGLIDNMNGFVCPHCGEEAMGLGGSLAFQAAMEYGIPYLGKIPLDPKVAKSAEDGKPFVLNKEGEIFKSILDEIIDRVGETPS
ncbi:MAG: Mrp/NBP35 family ATP-binding protein [Euryarchaeota archaeon]|nr:Mrp/NBP35 family ATP-binding protein [Euryarchaeota archaeon]